MNLKLSIINFALFIYTNHIAEEWDDLTPTARVLLYPAWWVKSAVIWITSPLLIPAYWVSKSKIYLLMQDVANNKKELLSVAEMKLQMKQNNKTTMQTFYRNKGNGNIYGTEERESKKKGKK